MAVGNDPSPSEVVARLRSDAESRWRWEISACTDNVMTDLPAPEPIVVPLAAGLPERLNERLAEVRTCIAPGWSGRIGVRRRSEAIRDLLHETWRGLMSPLCDNLHAVDRVAFDVPLRFAALPIGCARNRRSGESFVHLARSRFVWGGSPTLRPVGSERVVAARLDGHLEEIARDLARPHAHGTDGPPPRSLFLVGCTTIDLVPWLPGIDVGEAIVTIWDIDEAGASVMGDLVESGLAGGLDLDEALRCAAAGLSDRDPYLWAGYAAFELRTGSRERRAA